MYSHHHNANGSSSRRLKLIILVVLSGSWLKNCFSLMKRKVQNRQKIKFKNNTKNRQHATSTRQLLLVHVWWFRYYCWSGKPNVSWDSSLLWCYLLLKVTDIHRENKLCSLWWVSTFPAFIKYCSIDLGSLMIDFGKARRAEINFPIAR